MAETMEQYMSKTRADYGSGVARPKIEDKDNFELKGQFLKELWNLIFLSSDSSTNKDMNDCPSVAKVPKEGPSARPPPALLECIKDDDASDVSDSPKSKSKGNNLPVRKKASHKVIKNKNAKDTSDLSYNPKSNYEGKYVQVGKKANQKVIFESLILVTGCVIGLANGKSWKQENWQLCRQRKWESKGLKLMVMFMVTGLCC
ncbi:hypothetical protein Tco_0484355 [Tanacetum coccineum]